MKKPSLAERIDIIRQGVSISFAQANTIDRLCGAARGFCPPWPYLITANGGKDIILTVTHPFMNRSYVYDVIRNGEFDAR